MYTLEMGQFQSVPLPYSYVRRAQATVYRTIWKQIAMSAEIEPLEAYAKRLKRPGVEFRIAGVGEHCMLEPFAV